MPDCGQWIKDTSLYILQSKQDIGHFLRQRPGAPVKSFMDIYERGAFHPMNDLFHDIAGGPENPAEAADYYKMRVNQEAFRRNILDIMAQNELDFLLYPSVQVLPPTREELYALKWTCLTFPTNTVIASQSGLPAMSIPAGFTPDGIPVGFELLGKPFAEARLLQFAYGYEKLAKPRKTPNLNR